MSGPCAADPKATAEERFLALWPLAEAVARRFAPPEGGILGREDLIQAAALGLWKAVRAWRPEGGASPAGFAWPFVLGEVRRALSEAAGVGAGARRLFADRRRLAQARQAFWAATGREPTLPELAALTGLDAARLAEVSAPAVPLPEVPEGWEAGAAEDPAERLADRLTLAVALSHLGERERRVVGLRFFAGLSQAATGARLGLSQATVHRLERRALSQLARTLSPEGSPPQGGMAGRAPVQTTPGGLVRG